MRPQRTLERFLVKATDVPALPINFGWLANPHPAVCRDNQRVTNVTSTKMRRGCFIFL